MTSLLKDLHLKGCCSNLIHIWHNVFSCRTLPSIWKNQFSASSSLRPTDNFSFYYGYILSEFSVCSGNDINNQKMFTSFLQPHFDFLTCASCTVFSLASAAHSVLGFPGFRGPKQAFTCGGHKPRWWRVTINFPLCLLALPLWEQAGRKSLHVPRWFVLPVKLWQFLVKTKVTSLKPRLEWRFL